MLPRICADLPPLLGRVRKQPADTICHEQLAQLPSGAGQYLWILIEKIGLSSAQARAALARSVNLKAEDFSMAAARDRNARVFQWMSVKKDSIEHASALRNAGYKKMLKVSDVREHTVGITAESVIGLKYTMTVRNGVAEDGLGRASNLMSRLRQRGCPNYIGFQRMGPKGQHAKLGRSILRGKRVPSKIPHEKADCARYTQACQAQLFNSYIAQRIEGFTFDTVVVGEEMQCQLAQPWSQRALEIVTAESDIEHFQKRLDSWEAVQMGPLFGASMSRLDGQAMLLEDTILESVQIKRRALDRLRGYRRAIRFQPRSIDIVDRKKDIVVSCTVDPDVYITSLLEELMQPERHLL